MKGLDSSKVDKRRSVINKTGEPFIGHLNLSLEVLEDYDLTLDVWIFISDSGLFEKPVK